MIATLDMGVTVCVYATNCTHLVLDLILYNMCSYMMALIVILILMISLCLELDGIVFGIHIVLLVRELYLVVEGRERSQVEVVVLHYLYVCCYNMLYYVSLYHNVI